MYKARRLKRKGMRHASADEAAATPPRVFTPGITKGGSEQEQRLYRQIRGMFRYVLTEDAEFVASPARKRSVVPQLVVETTHESVSPQLVLTKLVRRRVMDEFLKKRSPAPRNVEDFCQKVIDNEGTHLNYFDELQQQARRRQEMKTRHPYANGLAVLRAMAGTAKAQVRKRLVRTLPKHSRFVGPLN